MLEEVLRSIISFGAGLTLLFGLSQLIVRNKSFRNWCFFWFYLSLSALLLTSFNIQTDLSMLYPALYLLEVPFLFILGPSMYIMFAGGRDNAHGLKQYAIHYVLPVLALAVLIPYYFEPVQTKVGRLTGLYNANEIMAGEVFFGLGFGSLGFYLCLMLYRMRNLWTVQFLQSKVVARQLAFVLVFGFTVFVIALIGVLTLDLIWLRTAMAALTLVICLIFMAGHRYPNFLQAFTFAVEQAKYKKSYLQGDDAVAIKNKLEQVMQTGRFYAKANPSVKKLADSINVTPHQLSQYLNVYEGKNFAGYINQYRVEQAIQLLTGHSNMPIHEIGVAVGFNSPSSFARAFRQVTATTPQEYRRLNGASHKPEPS